MEYMRLDSFLGSQLAKVINKSLLNKFGLRSGIGITKLNLETSEDGLVHLDLHVMMTQKDFETLIEEVTK